MKIGTFDLAQKVMVVAEVGNNHEGSFERAREMIHLAAEAGADAVKFQTFRTEAYISRSLEERFAMIKGFELSFDNFSRLKEEADQAGVMFFSSAFDLESVHFLAGLAPAFKIASADNTFFPLLECMAQYDKPVILSSGMAGIGRMTFAKALLEQRWALAGIQQEVCVLHCVAAYPVSPQEVNLGAISHLSQELKCTVGYSDHTLGIEAPVLAVAQGARLIEKHFTLDKNFSDFRDHQLSVDPPELARLVARVREAEVLMGAGRKVPQASEVEIESQLRRSAIVRRAMPKGSVVAWEDLAWVRPGGGLAPGRERAILGKALKRDLPEGGFIVPDDVEPGGQGN